MTYYNISVQLNFCCNNAGQLITESGVSFFAFKLTVSDCTQNMQLGTANLSHILGCGIWLVVDGGVTVEILLLWGSVAKSPFAQKLAGLNLMGERQQIRICSVGSGGGRKEQYTVESQVPLPPPSTRLQFYFFLGRQSHYLDHKQWGIEVVLSLRPTFELAK